MEVRQRARLRENKKSWVLDIGFEVLLGLRAERLIGGQKLTSKAWDRG